MNGDWSAMEKLVIAKMTEHSQHLGALRDDIAGIKTHIAVINDREDRELAAAKSVALRWGTAVGAIVSTFIGGLFAWFRPA